MTHSVASNDVDGQSNGLTNPTPQSCGIGLSLPSSVQVNDDDDQVVDDTNYEVHDFKHVPSLKDDDLQVVVVSASADKTEAYVDLVIKEGAERITSPADGMIFRSDPDKLEPPVMIIHWKVPAGKDLVRELYFEGVKHSNQSEDLKMEASIFALAGEVDGKYYDDCLVVTGVKSTAVYQVDLDVDSGNDNGYEFDGFTEEEDQLEVSERVDEATGEKRFGKIVLPTSNKDSDEDGIPDYADGFNLDGYVAGEKWSTGHVTPDPSDVTEDVKFIPVQLELKKPFDPMAAKVTFEYDPASLPEISAKGIERVGTGKKEDPYIYVIKRGGMRLWRKEAHNRTSGMNVPSGDYIPNKVAIDWNDLDPDGDRIAKIYLEYVDTWPATAGGRESITVIVNEDGATATDRVNVLLLPVEVVELAPMVKVYTRPKYHQEGEETGPVEQADSRFPDPTRVDPSPMVEVSPVTDRIAHRDLKVKVGKGDLLKGKKVTWSMDPAFYDLDGNESAVRGDWNLSANHPHWFEESTEFGHFSFSRTSATSCTSTIDENGYTAVRVNLPPIGFNSARVRLNIESREDPFDLIDLVVPAVIVIDPGHGGENDLEGSGANHAVSFSNVTEKAMTLLYGFYLNDALPTIASKRCGHIKVEMTRVEDRNLAGRERAEFALTVGADVFLSIHFNEYNMDSRGTEALVRGVRNVNMNEDRGLGERVVNAVVKSLQSYDGKARSRGVKDYAYSEELKDNVPSEWAVLSDSYYQNTSSYHPIRGVIAEIEFIDVKSVDQLLISGENSAEVTETVVNAIGMAILDDVVSER